MNLKNSLIILDLHNYNIYNVNKLSNQELKKAYHIMALNYHPDKSNLNNSKDKFQEINSAYNYLNKYIKENKENKENKQDFEYNDGFDNHCFDNDDFENNDYVNLINKFLDICIKNSHTKCNSEINNLKEECINYSFELFKNFIKKLHIDVLQDIYTCISSINDNNNNKYSQIIENIKQEIYKKKENNESYILTCDIENIINSNIFKLDISNTIVCVPLWHKELYYENNIIKIHPTLPNNIKIDNNNNLYYFYSNSYENIINILRNTNILNISIGKMDLKINLNELKFINNQNILFNNIGLPIINPDNIFDNTKKGNIIINVNLY